jgi:hypothetical protein
MNQTNQINQRNQTDQILATMGHEAFRFRAGLRLRFLFPSLEEGCNGVDGDREDGG